MSSTAGLPRKPRQRRPMKPHSPALKHCPQLRAIVKKSFITTPRKPNSAKRATAKVVICRTRKLVDIYLEGESFNRLNPHSVVLVRGRGPRDLPGVNYHAIRGKGDFPPLLNRRKCRSKYGAKRPSHFKREKWEQLFVLTKKEKLARRRYLCHNFNMNGRMPRRRY